MKGEETGVNIFSCFYISVELLTLIIKRVARNREMEKHLQIARREKRLQRRGRNRDLADTLNPIATRVATTRRFYAWIT